MRRNLWTIPLSLLGLALLAPLAGAVNSRGSDPATGPLAVLQAPATDHGPFDATDCKSCHEAAVTQIDQTKHGALEEGCATCHDRGKAMEHSKGRADGLETPGPSLTTMPAREVTAMCLDCHEKGDRTNFAGSIHDQKDVSCISCHSVHSFKSARGQFKTVKDSETCFSCHKQIRAKTMRTSHHPIREGKLDCASCHNPHDGTKPKMLKTAWINDTCYTCHTEKRGPFLWEHAPVRENCANCHDPHGSNHDKLLVAKQPFLCQRCHLNTRHPGTLYDGNNALTGASVSNRAAEHACKNCHQNVHGSNHPSGPYLGR
jgi:DmsE family decaheme c-type cytochrome